MDVVLRNITKRYGDKTVYQGFDLTLKEGEVTALLGPSGCGKTTLLNILGGLTPFEGEAEVPAEVSYLFQRDRLLPNLKVLDNLLYVLGGRPDARERALKTLSLVEMEGEADRYPRELSGGMAQRVAMARAFCFPSELLLMDEPFRNLDFALKLRLMQVFESLRAEMPRTCLFVTHDLEEALTLGDRVLILKAGKLAADVRLSESKPRAFGQPMAEREALFSALCT